VKKQPLSRRRFLQSTRDALAVGGLLGFCQPLTAVAAEERSPATNNPATADYYEKLGVTKMINAAGTYTALTASIMPPEVRRAVDQAALSPVRLKDLEVAAGNYLAKRLRCEAALVSAGAASALTLGTAACITVANREQASEAIMEQIPTGMAPLKNEVIVQHAHRYEYDHALLNCGIRFVEVRSAGEYRNAFSPRTIMAHFFNAAEGGEIGREEWIRVAHEHGVPCMNDAAADVPPISNLWNYTRMGFDLVCFSGGKGIRGPQNAGLLLGRKDLIEAAAENNSPNSARVGRGMKVAKEQIVGMVAAIDWFLSQTDEGLEQEFSKRAEVIASAVRQVPGVECTIFVPPVANHVPHLLIRCDQQRIKIAPREVASELRNGTPSIELNPATGSRSASAGLPTDENTIVVGVWMLQEGEDRIVGDKLRQVLAAHAAV
jgi:L-seryl-tRNA(Ser) seleniumtransferase